MTDNEIIKALECCKSFDDLRACYKCPALENGDCSNGKVYISDFILDNALDLINRQKAEIEDLKHSEEVLYRVKESLKEQIKELEAHNKEYRFCNLVDNVLIYSKTLKDYNDFRKAIIPKQGKWLINPDGYYPYCSECKKEPQGRAMTDFCPNCGANMRG